MQNKTYTQIKFDPVENWLNEVAYEGSGSSNTKRNYRRCFEWFTEFVRMSGDEIKSEYDSIEGVDAFDQLRKFRAKYTEAIKAWRNILMQKDLANHTITVYMAAVLSFFRHNNLPLDRISTAQITVEYHNKDITKQEIALIANIATPRDRAFYLFMAQSGLRPYTICKLQLKDIEYDRLKRDETPVKITVRKTNNKGKYAAYWSFIDKEATQTLNDYLKTRKNLSDNSYLFVKSWKAKTENDPLNPAVLSAQFGKTVRMLKESEVLKFAIPEAKVASDGRIRGKPSEVRLYNLRKFFDRGASSSGFEYKEYWMGHKLKVAHNYISQDPEHHRKLYAEKAAPNLRIQIRSPIETEKQIEELRERLNERDKKLSELSKTVAKAEVQKSIVAKLQKELSHQKLKTETITQENQKTRKNLEGRLSQIESINVDLKRRISETEKIIADMRRAVKEKLES